MKSALYLLIIACVSFPSFAVDMPPPKAPAADAIDAMKAEYYDQFSALPASRKCTPEDIHGIWKEQAIYEAGSTEENDAQRAQGPKYLVFADYNTLLWRRINQPVDRAALTSEARAGTLQYVATGAGMLYFYERGLLEQGLLCFTTAGVIKNASSPLLLLARPPEKDKPLTIVLYAPLEN